MVHLQWVTHPKGNDGLSTVKHPGFHIHNNTHFHAGGVPSCKGTIRLSNGSNTSKKERTEEGEERKIVRKNKEGVCPLGFLDSTLAAA